MFPEMLEVQSSLYISFWYFWKTENDVNFSENFCKVRILWEWVCLFLKEELGEHSVEIRTYTYIYNISYGV